jgi:DNA-directed RNA polymerase specialized sigma24 family protein
VSAEFEASLRDVYEGRATFDQLAKAHRGHFRALAASVMRRWKQPVWVTLEDVEQDVLLGAYQAIWKYEHGLGPTLSQYLVYNAYDKAKKKAHKSRNAVRSGNRADSNPGRMERGYGAVWGDDGDRRAEDRTASPATQEDALDKVQRLARHARGPEDLRVIRAATQLDCVEEWLSGDDAAMVECAIKVRDDDGVEGLEALKMATRAAMAVATGLATEAA